MTKGSTRDLRIALFCANYNCVRDGANNALNHLVSYLLQQGAQVRVYSPTVANPAFEPTGDLVSVRSVAIPGRSEYRLTLGLDGEAAVVAAPLGPAKAEWRVALAGTRLFSGDPWLGVKSTRRPLHDAARVALPARVDEAVFLNERGEVAEGGVVGHGLRFISTWIASPR